MTLTLRVLDGQGTAVPDAIIHLDDSHRAWSAGRTGPQGTLEVPSETVAGALQITATHPDFARSTAPIRPTASGAQTLVLHEGASIRGEVAWISGGGPASDVRVLAVPTENSMPSPSYVERALAELPSVNTTRTQADGTFEVAGLDKSRRYFVFAAWKGCFSTTAPPGVAPGGDPVRLELGRLFGVRIAYLDATTRMPIEVPRALISPRGNELRLPSAIATVLPCHGRWAELAGVSSTFTRETTSTETVYFFLGKLDGDPIGPLSYAVDLPGFQPTQGQLLAYPVDDRLFEHAVHLAPTRPRKTTRLRISFRGIPTGLDTDRSRVGPEGVLVLHGEGGSQAIALKSLGAESLEIEHVPQGEYNWRVVAESSTSDFAYPSDDAAHPLVLGEDPGHVVVDLSNSGAIEFVLEQVDGSRYVGPIDVQITNVTERSIQGHSIANIRFDRAPYAVSGVGAGNYELKVTSPRSNVSAAQEATVQPGRTSIARFEMR